MHPVAAMSDSTPTNAQTETTHSPATAAASESELGSNHNSNSPIDLDVPPVQTATIASVQPPPLAPFQPQSLTAIPLLSPAAPPKSRRSSLHPARPPSPSSLHVPPLGKRRGLVWSCFRMVRGVDDSVWCVKCNKYMVYKPALGTSNLRKHIATRHAEWRMAVLQQSKGTGDDDMDDDDDERDIASASASASPGPPTSGTASTGENGSRSFVHQLNAISSPPSYGQPFPYSQLPLSLAQPPPSSARARARAQSQAMVNPPQPKNFNGANASFLPAPPVSATAEPAYAPSSVPWHQTAMLVMDYQNDILTNIVPNFIDYIVRVNEVTDYLRAHGVLIIFVHTAFPNWPDTPEISVRNFNFSRLKHQQLVRFDGTNADVHSLLHRMPADVIITKKRGSSFYGTHLQLLLQANDIHHLVLCGVATSGCLLATVLEASDRDYIMTILRDGCWDPSMQCHDTLMNILLTRQGNVLSCKEFIAQCKMRGMKV